MQKAMNSGSSNTIDLSIGERSQLGSKVIDPIIVIENIRPVPIKFHVSPGRSTKQYGQDNERNQSARAHKIQF